MDRITANLKFPYKTKGWAVWIPPEIPRDIVKVCRVRDRTVDIQEYDGKRIEEGIPLEYVRLFNTVLGAAGWYINRTDCPPYEITSYLSDNFPAEKEKLQKFHDILYKKILDDL